MLIFAGNIRFITHYLKSKYICLPSQTLLQIEHNSELSQKIEIGFNEQ